MVSAAQTRRWSPSFLIFLWGRGSLVPASRFSACRPSCAVFVCLAAVTPMPYPRARSRFPGLGGPALLIPVLCL